MAASWFVALLRGINVGGRRKVPMAELRTTLSQAGYGGVQTYIQSGNVVLSADTAGPAGADGAGALEAELSGLLAERFGFEIPVLVRSRTEMARVVAQAPAGFGADPDRLHYDVMFCRATLPPGRVIEIVAPRDGVDTAWAGTGVVYFARLIERRAQSRMSRIVGRPEYSEITVRNWATTTAVQAMVEGAQP